VVPDCVLTSRAGVPIVHVFVCLARTTNRIEIGRPAIAPPSASVFEAGKHLSKAEATPFTKVDFSASVPGSIENDIRGFPRTEPSRFRLKTTVI
jgi:hypothetical protein